jgi:hypothetical protein
VKIHALDARGEVAERGARDARKGGEAADEGERAHQREDRERAAFPPIFEAMTKPSGLSLDQPIQTMIDATNRGDTAVFLTAFADDAVLVDWGRTFSGKAEIAKWNQDENIGTQNHLRVTGVHRSGTQVRVTVTVTGNGYNGDGTFVFDLSAQGITRMVIS